MKICVLIKQVPNEDAIIKISPDGSGIITDNVTYCTNEPDTYALEEALIIKESVQDCEVVVCTMGKEAASQILKEALAKGADRAILIDSANTETLDPLGISKIISKVIQKEGYLLISTIITALTNIPLNYIFYYKYGLIGIAYSTLIVNIFGSAFVIIITVTVLKKYNNSINQKDIGSWIRV